MKQENGSAPSVRTDYDLAWKRLRNLKLVAVLIFIASLPCGLLMSTLMDRYQPLGVIVLWLPIVALWYVIYRTNSFQCPRCKGRFDPLGTYSLWKNQFGKRCAKCGLKKFSREG
jgi:hypothetical protein